MHRGSWCLSLPQGSSLKSFSVNFHPLPYTRALAFSFCPHNAGFVLFSFLLFSSEHPLWAPCSLCKWLLLLYPPAARQPHTHILTHSNSLSDSNTHLQSIANQLQNRQATPVLLGRSPFIFTEQCVKTQHALSQLQLNLCTSVLCVMGDGTRFELGLGVGSCRWRGENTARLSLGGGWTRSEPEDSQAPGPCPAAEGGGEGGRHKTALTARPFHGNITEPSRRRSIATYARVKGQTDPLNVKKEGRYKTGRV